MSRDAPAPRQLLAPALVALVLLAGCGSGGERARPATTTRPVTPTTQAPSSSTTTTTTAPTTTTTTAPVLEPATDPGELTAGAHGLRTYALQEHLRQLKYDPGPSDGRYGTKTMQAIWAYQALHGYDRSGTVSEALYDEIMNAAPQGMLRPDLGPTHTEIDLDRQVLLVWRDGQLQLITHVSSGSGRHYCETSAVDPTRQACGSAVTPEGDFTFLRRIPGWRISDLGKLYNPIYFKGGFAVHGAPSVPNYPASHGCVRIPMHVSEYFPSLVNDGEPVSVYRGGSGPTPTA